MKVIIAGSRDIAEYTIIEDAIKASQLNITEVVSGTARGVDTLGELWAKKHNVPVKQFKAAWDDISVKGAVIRKNRFGKLYNTSAGFARNEQMAVYAEALIAIWDGKSNGTRDMIERARNHNLEVFIYMV